ARSTPRRSDTGFPDAGIQSCGIDFTAPGVAFSPSGRQLAEGLCRGAVVIADGRTGRVVRTVRLGGPGGSVAYSPDGSILAATSLGRSGVLLIDPATGRVRGTATVQPQGRMQIA